MFFLGKNGNVLSGGIRNGITEYVHQKDTFIDYSFKRNVHHIHFDSLNRQYWVGSEWDVVIWNKSQNKITPIAFPFFSKKYRIKQLYQNSLGIWIVTNQGLLLFNPKTQQLIKHYTKSDGYSTLISITFIKMQMELFGWGLDIVV